MIDAVEASFTAVPHAHAFELKTDTPLWAASPQGAITMDEDNKVVAETRETFGKGAARKIRAAG